MKNLIITILLCSLSSGIFSQSLDDTQWKVQSPGGAFTIYVNFSMDTVRRSNDGIIFSPVGTYEENIDTLTVMDIDPALCGTDEGIYTFDISNDTLSFSLVNDNCMDRSVIFITGIWTNNPSTTNIEALETIYSIKAYPNPVSNILFIESDFEYQNVPYIIFNQLGQEVLSGQLTNQIHSINTNEIPTGLYYIQIGKENKETITIVKH